MVQSKDEDGMAGSQFQRITPSCAHSQAFSLALVRLEKGQVSVKSGHLSRG